jgi:hypothetical protein
VLALTYLVLAAAPCPAGTWCNENEGLAYDAVWIDGTGPKDLWAWNRSDVLAHFDGTTWSPVAAPEGSVVEGLAVRGAVLLTRPRGAPAGPATVHRWSGSAWTRLTSTDGPYGDVCSAADDDIWLVGRQAGHLRAGKLEPVTFGSGSLYSCTARAPDDVWAVGVDGGETLLLHWDGKGFSREVLPQPNPLAVRTSADGSLWVYCSGVALQKVKGAWKTVAEDSYLAVSTGSVILAARYGKPLLALTPKVKAPAKPPVLLHALYAASAKDVWGAGAGVFTHWDGKSWKGGERLSREELMHVSGNRDGEVWALDGQGNLLRRTAGTWAKMAAPPNHAHDVYSASPRETWVAGNGVARWDGERWQSVDALKKERFRAIGGTGADDVWAVGGDAWHWDGKTWTKRETAGSSAEFIQVVGDGKGKTWLLEKGARPENFDGPSTGLDDDILELADGKPARRLAPKDRPASIAFAAGALWTVAGQKTPLKRFDGQSWAEVKAPEIGFTRLLELRGAPLLFGNDGAARREGDTWVRLPSHDGLMTIDAWSDGAQLFAVGRDGLLLRWEAPK